MADLCGKGVWLAHSNDLQRAAELCTSIEGTHLLVKVGHGPFYFPEIARTMAQRVRSLGFHPLAWIEVTDRATQDAAKAVAEALARGFQGAILYLGRGLVTASQVAPLATALEDTEVPRQRIYIATPPLPHLPDRDALKVLIPFCGAGWMPLCFATWGESAEQLIDRSVYHALGDLSLLWGKTPMVYPVLSPALGPRQETPMLAEEFIPWIEAVARHGIDFLSVYHAANTEKVLWPMLQSVNVSCMQTGERRIVTETEAVPGVAIPQPVYVTVTASDTVWGIIIRHGITKQQFWSWNAHLWESRGLPRDPDYLQEGWRIRVK